MPSFEDDGRFYAGQWIVHREQCVITSARGEICRAVKYFGLRKLNTRGYRRDVPDCILRGNTMERRKEK